MADLKQFAANMRKHAQNIEANADRLVRRCALAIDAAVVLATPVDTGRARANWQVQLNSPAGGTVAPASAEAAIAAGRSTILAYKGGSPEAAIHITNNLDYIGKLNDGYSAQAPAGFVEKASLIGVQAIRSAGGIVSTNIQENP